MSDLIYETTHYTLATCSGEVVGCFRCDSAAPTTEVPAIELSGTPENRRHALCESTTADKEDGRTERICRFCYETELGHILAYPRGQGDLLPLARALCQAFNLIHWDGKTVPEVEVPNA